MSILNLVVQPGGTLSGCIPIPGDKSITHRALIIGALTDPGSSVVLRGWLNSLDCQATLAALHAMGVECVHLDRDTLQMTPVGLHGLQEPHTVLDAGNSGTTLRLLTGVLAAQKFSSCITGDAALRKRPMRRIIVPLTQMGAKIFAVSGEHAPLAITGGQNLRAINYTMPIASAQVKSAILLTSLYTVEKSNVQSPSMCRDHTELMLQHFTHIYDIPSDISSAAFFIVGASISPGADIFLENIGINPTRSAILTILSAMGANITLENTRTVHGELRANFRVRFAKRLRAITVPLDLVANVIDELPILCLAAACAQGTTIIRGAQELRHKESDRIALMAQGLRTIGIQVNEFSDGLAITGGVICGGTVVAGGDHRIAMTFAMASLVAQGGIIIQDTQNIATSFPDFVPVACDAGMRIVEA